MAFNLARFPDVTEKTPAEIKQAIAAYLVSSRDLKSLSLVNMCWSKAAAFYLWRTFSTDFIRTRTRSIGAWMRNDSNIRRYVRRIHVLSPEYSINILEDFRMFVLSLREGQLLGLVTTIPIPSSYIVPILKLQPKMTELQIPEDRLFTQILLSPYTQNFISNLTKATVDIKYCTPAMLWNLWKFCPNLEDLDLQSSYTLRRPSSYVDATNVEYFTEAAFGSFPSDRILRMNSAEVAAFRDNKIHSLSLRQLRLPKYLYTVCPRIDIMRLRNITLEGCTDVAAFINGLTEAFQYGRPALEELHITRTTYMNNNVLAQSVSRLLYSFTGLRRFSFHGERGTKIDVASIAYHGYTLESLLIVTGGVERQRNGMCYGVKDIQTIAKCCPYLRELCLNLYELVPDDMDEDRLGLGLGKGPTRRAGPFREAITAIASMWSLEILRITNAPNYRHTYHLASLNSTFSLEQMEARERRFAFQNRADILMWLLQAHGATLKFVVFAPLDGLGLAGAADVNGHQWPNYAYGRRACWDEEGWALAIAEPVKLTRQFGSEYRILTDLYGLYALD